MVRLLLPDLLRLLEDPVCLLCPVPGLAVLLDVRGEGNPGTDEGREDPAQGQQVWSEGGAAAGLVTGHGSVLNLLTVQFSMLGLQLNIYWLNTLGTSFLSSARQLYGSLYIGPGENVTRGEP